ncbi:MAG: M20 family metallopeptidase [Planctomycetota bacterium]|jgi:acetylornithine deacetylase
MPQLTDYQKRRVRKLLTDLVAIDSTATSAEGRIAGYLTDYLKRLGMTVKLQEVYPGRPNLIAHWPKQISNKSLMLEAHMDTVSIDGMNIEPFAADIQDGRMYGRGTCDTKGSMAAILMALTLAKRGGKLPADKLYFVATMSEETGCDGASALMKTDFRTDVAIVGEPTKCELVTAHKGPLWMEIETLGTSRHAALATAEDNAIESMSRIVQFVHGPWTEHIQRRRHRLLGKSTAAVTTISGGSSINIIPPKCRVEVDCRVIPGQSLKRIIGDFKRMLAGHLGGDKFTVKIIKSFGSLDCPADTPIAKKLLRLCRNINGQDSPRGVNYFADSGPFSQAGITCVLFGPGDIAQAHTADEYIELDQLYQATEILHNLLTRYAGKSIVA